MKHILCLMALLFAVPTYAADSTTSSSIIDMSSFATVNSVTAVANAMPVASDTAPPCVADGSSLGTGTQVFALWNHTHCSKARKDRLDTLSDGTLTATFSLAFGAGIVPRCSVDAETVAGNTDVISAKMDGPPTNTQIKIRVTKTTPTLNALLGLLIPVVAATPGVTKIHYICIEP